MATGSGETHALRKPENFLELRGYATFVRTSLT